VNRLYAFTIVVFRTVVIASRYCKQRNLPKMTRNVSFHVARWAVAQIAASMGRFNRPLEDLQVFRQGFNCKVVLMVKVPQEELPVCEWLMTGGLAEKFHTMGLGFMAKPSVDAVEKVVLQSAFRESTHVWLKIRNDMVSEVQSV
jgi:hypothetical protein